MRTGSPHRGYPNRREASANPRTRARRFWLGVTVALATLGAVLTAMEVG